MQNITESARESYGSEEIFSPFTVFIRADLSKKMRELVYRKGKDWTQKKVINEALELYLNAETGKEQTA